MYGLLRALNQQGRWLWWLLAIWIALAILTKGPVCLLFICPPMILLSVWFKDKTKSHYYKMLGSFCLALLFALLWAGPAAWLGGKRYADAIFWHQSAGRIAGEFGGIKHWYAYLEFLLWLLFPWSLWWVLWRGLWRFFKESLNQENSSLRFLAAVIIPALVCLTIIPVKSERYIIPLLPWFALFFSYILVRYSVNLRGYDQILISLIYIALGISYLILPHISSPLFQHRFYWMAELSPIWGYIQIALGILIAFLSYAGNRVLILNLTLMSTAVFVIFNLGWVKIEAKHNDLRPMALQIAELERHQAPIALYQSDFEFEFFGRLRHPSTLISSRHALNKWIQAHPNGWVVSVNPHVYPKQFILKPASDYSLNGNKSNF